MQLRRRLGLRVACGFGVTAVALLLIPAAMTRSTNQSATPNVWTQADVDKAATKAGVAPFKTVYAVPKKLSKRYKIGFINPDLANPFFATWSKAMKAAAKFYGVDYVVANAGNKYDTETDLYDQLAAQGINAVGAHPGNAVIAAKAGAAKIPFTTIDAAVPGASRLGVPDVQAGQLAARLLAPEIKKRQLGAWKGKDIVFVGLGAPGCTPCEVRPHAAQTLLSRLVKVGVSEYIPGYATPDVGQKFITDLMTKYPNSVFAIVPLNDESLIGVLQGLKDAGRTQDAVAVTLGGDPAGRKFIRDTPKLVIAGIDFNPYGEAWNFIAASIARLQGKSFKPYTLSTTLTPANINKYYPKDPK
jgi:ribose transport system substrate-binding protein